MSLPDENRFLLTVCQVGAERALKQEVAREHPHLRPAYARPGLVTFKSAERIDAGVEFRSVFARAFAVALGPAKDIAALCKVAERVLPGQRLRLHTFARDVARPGETMNVAGEAAVVEVRASLLAAAGALFLPGEVAEAGDHVLDVVVAQNEPLFVGHHLHSAAHSPHPGGQIPVIVPADAPSRAYRKLAEALVWSGAPVEAGQVAVEIGSAPGGASLFLLRRGLTVVGVDPGAMAAVVLASPRFRHLQIPVGELRREQLPARVDWLVLDVNLAPQVALHAVRGVVAGLRKTLRGVLFTLKLNDWEMAAEVPELCRRIEAMGMVDVYATHLPSNRQEIFVYGRFPGVETTRSGAHRGGKHRR